MAISRMLVFLIFMVSLAEISGSAQPECHIDAIDAIAGETFIIGTWSLNNATLSITVKREDTIRFSYFFNGRNTKLAQDREGRLLLKLDNLTTEVSLMFGTVGREDEGQYRMKIFFRGAQSDRYGRKDGEYTFQLNVIEKNEEIQGCEGDNISRELETTPESFFLYRYDKTIATVMKSGCWVSEESIVYGRLRCNSKNDRYTISINNATQLDTGLYKIQDPMNSSSIQRWFFNISDKPTHANIGDNVVISWFYKQPGINCTIRVIHPYEGAIMLVPSNNVAQIRSNVRHRLLYSGDVSRNYMSFTLRNVIASDGGFYTIESLYETIISGRKLLTVKANITTKGLNTESVYRSVTDVLLHYDSSDVPKSEKDTNAAVNESSTQIRISTSTSPSGAIMSVPSNNVAEIRSNVRHRRLYSGDVSINYMSFTLLNVIASDGGFCRIESLYETIIPGSIANRGLNTELIDTSVTDVPLQYDSRDVPKDQKVSVPIYVIPVIIVMVVVLNLMVYCLRRIRSKNTSDRPNEIQVCDADAYITPVSIERPLLVPLMSDKRLSQTKASPNEEFDFNLWLLHRTPSLCMDGYEMVDIPSRDDHLSKSNNEETIYVSTENKNTDIQDTFGYLTVLGVLETSV